jgi:hypothetical protein
MKNVTIIPQQVDTTIGGAQKEFDRHTMTVAPFLMRLREKQATTKYA